MNKRNPKTLLGLILLAIFLCGIGFLLPETLRTAGEVSVEKSLTPTPLPPYGNVMAVTPDPNAPTPQPLLRVGSTGQRVTDLQARLAVLGYYTGDVDGQYGAATRDAVALFQQQNGLMTDGLAGSETCDLLFSAQAAVCRATEAPTDAAE